MNVIRVQRTIDSENLHLPELKGLIGKTVEITVAERPVKAPATEQDWEQFFNEGPIEFEANLVQH